LPLFLFGKEEKAAQKEKLEKKAVRRRAAFSCLVSFSFWATFAFHRKEKVAKQNKKKDAFP